MANLEMNDDGMNHSKRSFVEDESTTAVLTSSGNNEANTSTKSDVDVAVNESAEPASKRIRVESSEEQSLGEAEPKYSAIGSTKVESSSAAESKPRVKGLAPIKPE